jgi:hypothetical protein
MLIPVVQLSRNVLALSPVGLVITHIFAVPCHLVWQERKAGGYHFPFPAQVGRR